jgi:hypothetical protein
MHYCTGHAFLPSPVLVTWFVAATGRPILVAGLKLFPAFLKTKTARTFVRAVVPSSSAGD